MEERLIPVSVSERLSCDNLPTGSVLVLMRRHEMPTKMCVERYWCGLEKPERLAYVQELTATRMVRTYGAIGRCSCSACGFAVEVSDAYCRECGARFIRTDYEKVGSK